MSYDLAYDPYIDSKTGILKNRLGATTQEQLSSAEAEITYLVIATLTQGSNIENLTFDASLLLDIHKEIFQDIYSWAGKIRTHDISKDWAFFCHAPHIESQLNIFSKELKDDQALDSSRAIFSERVAHYYDTLNAIHPFREGNGRAIRTFLRLLALQHGHDIEWARLNATENISASESAMKGDIAPMQRMIRSLVTEIDI